LNALKRTARMRSHDSSAAFDNSNDSHHCAWEHEFNLVAS
jgi:hypothetical protein